MIRIYGLRLPIAKMLLCFTFISFWNVIDHKNVIPLIPYPNMNHLLFNRPEMGDYLSSSCKLFGLAQDNIILTIRLPEDNPDNEMRIILS